MQYAIGTRKDPNISKTIVEKLQIPYPNLEEQLEIAHVLDAMGETLRRATTKMELLKELFQTLLHQLMTAQLRVDDLDLSHLTEHAEAT